MNAQSFGSEHSSAARQSDLTNKQVRILLCLIGAVGFYGLGSFIGSTRVVVSEDAVKASLAYHLPELKITAIDCRVQPDRCEIRAGDRVFSTDYQGHKLAFSTADIGNFEVDQTIKTGVFRENAKAFLEEEARRLEQKNTISQGVE